MRMLFIFLDGVGLGVADPDMNPFAAAQLPTLDALANGHRWLADIGVQVSSRALFKPIDAQLGVPGRPQSGTSQAAMFTGVNVPQRVGRHYGPKPDAATRAIIAQDNLFQQLTRGRLRAALINAYPPRFHADIARGKTLRSSIQHAVHTAGLPMFTERDLYSGDALSEDFTGMGWREHLGYTDTPVYTPEEVGQRMAQLATRYDFALFSHWLTDVIGHRGGMAEGVALLETFDAVMRGLLAAWDDTAGLIVITSDHGNMEDLNTRKHTENAVPLVVIGEQRRVFAAQVEALDDLTAAILAMLLSDT